MWWGTVRVDQWKSSRRLLGSNRSYGSQENRFFGENLNLDTKHVLRGEKSIVCLQVVSVTRLHPRQVDTNRNTLLGRYINRCQRCRGSSIWQSKGETKYPWLWVQIPLTTFAIILIPKVNYRNDGVDDNESVASSSKVELFVSFRDVRFDSLPCHAILSSQSQYCLKIHVLPQYY